MEKVIDVYGIGSGISDIQIKVAEQFLTDRGLPKGEMRLVSAEEQHSLLSAASESMPAPVSGGSAANTIVMIAKLGGKTSYCCLLGEDRNGLLYREEMAHLGIDCHLKPQANAVTGTCLVLITPDAERTMNTHLGVSAELDHTALSEERVASAKWIFIEGYLFAQEGGRGMVRSAIECAKRNQTKIAVSFSDVFIVENFREDVEFAARSSDLVVANSNEACKFAKVSDWKAALEFLSKRCALSVVTRSEFGASFLENGLLVEVPSHPIQAVDATGAGDAFAGGLLSGLTRGNSIQDSVKIGCFLGSRVVSQLGPRWTATDKDRKYLKQFSLST